MKVSILRAQFPGGVFPSGCPSRVLLDHVTSKWGVLVLLALAEGEPLRWSELRRRAEGVSEKMLAQTLRTLEADGLVHRDAKPVVPAARRVLAHPARRGPGRADGAADGVGRRARRAGRGRFRALIWPWGG